MSDKTSAFDELDYFELNPMLKQPCSQGYFRRATTSGAPRPDIWSVTADPRTAGCSACQSGKRRARLERTRVPVRANPDVAAAYAEASFRADSHIGPRT
jgi:hypothetical protein